MFGWGALRVSAAPSKHPKDVHRTILSSGRWKMLKLMSFLLHYLE
jgi:hypothetical protein